MRIIDADELKSFFYSEYSGTDEIIEELMTKYNLDYLHDIDEFCVKQFAWDLLNGVCNVIDTQETISTVKSNNICDYCTKKGTCVTADKATFYSCFNGKEVAKVEVK